MHKKIDRTEAHCTMNVIIGNNLRFMRRLKKMSLMQLAEKMKVKYQQVGKYELGQNQLSAYRIYQASNILGVKVKYFFDKTYIQRMHGYHSTKIKEIAAAMPSELLDIDELQADVERELAYIDFKELQKNANV